MPSGDSGPCRGGEPGEDSVGDPPAPAAGAVHGGGEEHDGEQHESAPLQQAQRAGSQTLDMFQKVSVAEEQRAGEGAARVHDPRGRHMPSIALFGPDFPAM